MERQPTPTRDQVLEQLEKDVWLADLDADTFTVMSVPNGLQRSDWHRRSERNNADQKRRLGFGRVLLRCLICLVAAMLLTATLTAGAVSVVCLGPSESARLALVRYTAEHPYLSFVPRIFFSPAQISQMLAGDAPILDSRVIYDPVTPPAAQAVELSHIEGVGFTGTVLSVAQASRIRVAAIDSFSTAKQGALLTELVGASDVAAVSGGLFYDPKGNGKGGMPTGVVIQNSKILRAASTVTVAGFTQDGVLSVSRQSGKQALAAGIVQGVAAEALLIANGQAQSLKDTSVAARTAVAQLPDGTVLFVCINGNAPNSVGATVQQLQQLLLERGAVTAALLNSGGSCAMLYEQKQVSGEGSVLPRRIPTAFVIG